MRRRKNSSTSVLSAPMSSHLSGETAFSFIRRKVPALASLLIGVLLGLLVAQAFTPAVSTAFIPPIHTVELILSTLQPQAREKWNANTNLNQFSQRLGLSSQNSLPTLQQRRRVLQLLATLTGHHTRYCLRKAQKPYVKQVYSRYDPLVGYERAKSSHSILNNLIPTRKSIQDNQEPDRFNGPASKSASRPQTALSFKKDHKYFFAINLYNSFDVIPDLFSNMFKVSAILGYQNVFVSVYENGSTDQTKALLRIFDALCRSVGLQVIIRTSLRTRGAFHHRIEYLAEVRNAALAPLQEMRDQSNTVFDSIIFMNDVLPCVDDLLELIWQSRRQNAGITCGSDYIFHDEVVRSLPPSSLCTHSLTNVTGSTRLLR